jgi:hypothetical protein
MNSSMPLHSSTNPTAYSIKTSLVSGMGALGTSKLVSPFGDEGDIAGSLRSGRLGDMPLPTTPTLSPFGASGAAASGISSSSANRTPSGFSPGFGTLGAGMGLGNNFGGLSSAFSGMSMKSAGPAAGGDIGLSFGGSDGDVTSVMNLGGGGGKSPDPWGQWGAGGGPGRGGGDGGGSIGRLRKGNESASSVDNPWA